MKDGPLLELGRVSDRDQIRDAVADIFCPHGLDVRRGSGLDASVLVQAVGAIKLVWVTYGAPVRIDVPPPPEPFHLVQIPLQGYLSVTSGDEEVVSDSAFASVPDPRLPCTMRWEAHCSEVILRIDDDLLHQHLESLLGHPVKAPLHFSLGMPLDSGPGSSWRAAIDLLITELGRAGGLLKFPLVSSQLESLILTGLLTAQPHNYTTALLLDTGPAPPRAIRRALDYIEAESDRAITTARLAAQVGISARALQRGFQEHVGCSPMDYLRDVRLKRAKDLLSEADASAEITVTEVALECGFMHLGRFSVEYRRRFGESPSETLRR